MLRSLSRRPHRERQCFRSTAQDVSKVDSRCHAVAAVRPRLYLEYMGERIGHLCGGRVGECLILRENGVMSIGYVLTPQQHFPAILFRMPGGVRINNAPPFCELANVRRNIIGNGKFLGAAIGIVASDGEAAGTLW